MADKEDDPKDLGKITGHSSKNDRETAALICQPLAALEKQQGKPASMSKVKFYNINSLYPTTLYCTIRTLR